MNQTSVTPLATYRNERPYPFCPGCGHGPILNHLNSALVSLGVDASEVVIVSDIGCSGLSDQYFATSAFHGLHGRSITYATGIKLARPDLKVVVIMGDGGTGIGGAHLLSAARRNVGITVIVMNNFNFGMTGGQHSVTTPTGALTSTTPGGNLERPLDICATVAANGAGYVFRGTNFDKDLAERIADGMRSECFALLDVWDLCTAYFVPRNKASRKTLSATLDQLGFESGVLRDEDVAEYAAAYRAACKPHAGKPTLAPRPLDVCCTSALDRRLRIVVAGSAGGKVRSASGFVARAAILSGLWSAQKDDYPITIMTGHSVAELVLDSEEIHYTAVSRPDALLILSDDGLGKARKFLARMGADDHVFVLPEFADVETAARICVIDPARAQTRLTKAGVALYALTYAVAQLGILPVGAFEASASHGNPAYREENLRTVREAYAAALA
ncbi:MAG: hypothetical protein GY711_25775 [bacterium]|nr:hypothetical protein [bacterium]